MAPCKTTYKLAQCIAITVVGVSVLAIGIVMIVAPGPALVLTPVGLAILGTEKKEPEKPNSLIIWRVDPTRNDPRLLAAR